MSVIGSGENILSIFLFLHSLPPVSCLFPAWDSVRVVLPAGFILEIFPGNRRNFLNLTTCSISQRYFLACAPKFKRSGEVFSLLASLPHSRHYHSSSNQIPARLWCLPREASPFCLLP